MPSTRNSINDIEMTASADTSGQVQNNTVTSEETRRVSLSGSAAGESESSNVGDESRTEESLDLDPWKRLHVTRIHEKPAGYPRMAAFQASDPNFAMARNFSYLRARVMLQKQEKLLMLERKLDEMDAADAKYSSRVLRSREYDISTRGKRKDNLIDQIDLELRAYDELLLRERTMRSIERPSKRNYNSVLAFLEDEEPLVETEEEALLHPNEIVSLGGSEEQTWLEGKLEQYLKKILPLAWAQKIFTEPEMRAREGEELPHYFSKKRIGYLAKAAVQTLTIVIALAPTALLFTLRTTEAVQMVIVLVAIICFSGAVAACTRSRHQDVFMMTAAYAAVLVVFLGSSSSQQSSAPSPAQHQPP